MYAVSYSMKFSPKKLARLILDSGMQKGELADKVNKRPQTVNGWITGKWTPPMEVIQQLSEIFGVDPLYFFNGDEEERSEWDMKMDLLKQKNPAQYKLIRDLIDNLLN